MYMHRFLLTHKPVHKQIYIVVFRGSRLEREGERERGRERPRYGEREKGGERETGGARDREIKRV